MLCACIHSEALNVGISLVGIIEHSSPHNARAIFFNSNYSLVVVILSIERCSEEIAVFHHHKYSVVAEKLAKQFTAAVIVQAKHIVVEPHFAATKRRHTALLERNAVYFVFSYHVTPRKLSFNQQIGKVDVELQHFEALLWFECDSQRFSFAVGICSEPNNSAAGLTLSDVIFFVASDSGHGKALHVCDAAAAILI